MGGEASYPLEQIQVIKQKKLEDAEQRLRERRDALKIEQDKLANVEKERDVVKKHKTDKLTQLREEFDRGTTTTTKIQQMKQYLKVVDEDLKKKEQKVKEQQKHVDIAEAEVEKARQEVFKRHQDVEKMEIHRKEWEKERHAYLERKEADLGDEIGSAMHIIRKRKKKKP